MSYKRISPMPIVEGGTNATSFATTDGIVYYDGTLLNTTSAGSYTDVLMSQGGGGSAPLFESINNIIQPSLISWTPVLYGSITAGSPTYTIQSGLYYTIGNTVIAQFTLQCSSFGTAAGNITIGGFPFAVNGAANYLPTGTLETGGGAYASAIIGTGGTTTAYSNLTIASLSLNFLITGQLIYHT